MNHNPSVFTINDNYYTPREAWEDISHLIPANKIIYYTKVLLVPVQVVCT